MSNNLITQKKEYLTRQALNIGKRMAQDIIDLSCVCHEYHEEYGYKEYQRWWTEDLKFGNTRGKHILHVYNTFGAESALNSNLQTEVLYLLSAPSTPESARTEAIEKAESGEAITHKQAKELVEAHKKIEGLEVEKKNLESMLPTDDVRQRIASLEQQLVDAQNQPTVEVPPPDYAQTKEDLKQAQQRARLLEASLMEEQAKEPEVIERVPEKYKKMEDDYTLAQQQVEKLGAQLRKLSDVEDRQKAEKREIDAMDLLSDANKNIRKSLALLDSRGEAVQRSEILWNSIIGIENLISEYKENFNTMEAFNDIIDI